VAQSSRASAAAAVEPAKYGAPMSSVSAAVGGPGGGASIATPASTAVAATAGPGGGTWLRWRPASSPEHAAAHAKTPTSNQALDMIGP
jgi:hypothetical protein